VEIAALVQSLAGCDLSLSNVSLSRTAGGLPSDYTRWVSLQRSFFLPVKVPAVSSAASSSED
jgi:hypothetical protein